MGAQGELAETHVDDGIGQVLGDEGRSFGGEGVSRLIVMVDVGANGAHGTACLPVDFGGGGRVEVSGVRREVVGAGMRIL